MRIVACYKYVLDERDIRINPEDRALVTDRAAWKISDYDRNAIEEAVRIKERSGGAAVFGLTAGPAQAKASLKDALSRGLDEVYFVQDESLAGADPRVTARVLARALEKIGDCRLVLCGEGASDDYAQQVGPRLGVLLGWPVVTYVSKLEITGDTLRAERKLEDGLEIVEVELPAVVTVTGEVNQPRIPSLKQVMAAGKKPMHIWSLADLGLGGDALAAAVEVRSLRGAVTDRKRVVFRGDPAEAVVRLVEALVKEGLI
ncbi:MAG: electron transfer flavoprotein beta subunit/FixA family protein [Firmicutes bacterium]|nr:electron transfer flavoprotein beta subunit/FixA family protein [Bacillota bacterium]